jgi:hypothetical protein
MRTAKHIRTVALVLIAAIFSVHYVRAEVKNSSAVPDRQPDDILVVPPYSPKFTEYLNGVLEKCLENRRGYFPLKNKVIVRCFLTDDGALRAPSILLSSGRKMDDLSCIDAVLMAAPVSPPPSRGPESIPGVSCFFVESSLPSGFIELVFEPNNRDCRLEKWDDNAGLQVPLIPLEVLSRYPGLFTKEELMSARNFQYLRESSGLHVPMLCAFRYPWTEFFAKHKTPTRAEILERLDLIQSMYSPVGRDEVWKDRWSRKNAPSVH